jgi:hypothetical protein
MISMPTFIAGATALLTLVADPPQQSPMPGSASGASEPAIFTAPPAPPAAPTINMATVLHDEDGKPVQDCDPNAVKPDPPKDCEPLTLGRAAAHALFFGRYPGEEGLSGDAKWARGALAIRIRDTPSVSLSEPEIAVIEKCIGRFYAPGIIAQAFPLLNPKANLGPIQ